MHKVLEKPVTYFLHPHSTFLPFSFSSHIPQKHFLIPSYPPVLSVPPFSQLLRPTVSIAVLEEKTALFVKGKTDAKTYYGVLKAAFGDKLGSVLPQIVANLPAKKAAELTKVAA
jgi:hypothetical protein